LNIELQICTEYVVYCATTNQLPAVPQQNCIARSHNTKINTVKLQSACPLTQPVTVILL